MIAGRCELRLSLIWQGLGRSLSEFQGANEDRKVVDDTITRSQVLLGLRSSPAASQVQRACFSTPLIPVTRSSGAAWCLRVRYALAKEGGRRCLGGERFLRGARGGAAAADGSCRLRVLRHVGEKGDIPGQIYPRVVESPSGTPFDLRVACF